MYMYAHIYIYQYIYIYTYLYMSKNGHVNIRKMMVNTWTPPKKTGKLPMEDAKSRWF